MKTASLIGYGQFGRFMAVHLAPLTDLVAHDPFVSEADIPLVDLPEALSKRVIILALPAHRHEAFWQEAKDLVNPEAIIIDVSSVKTRPLELMRANAPASCQLLGLHPVFGPQSANNGIAGLKIMSIAERMNPDLYERVKAFMSQTLELEVIEMSAEEHDKEMAYVQALTFFIGKALVDMNIPNERLVTSTYRHLLDLKEIVGNDSEELYRSIQLQNPYAIETRELLVSTLNRLSKDL